ncbi:hypothetical protein EZS27_009401 [termite gut metagenome]|jgi:hypothetical protein|uniref:Uncharacterized protein n=1 Tax=termite gut metagenome TaxID=433724 RepID=A0A5J4S9N7_9ZZZZ
MFGIKDPLILTPYILLIVCVVFAVWYGIKNWSEDNEKDQQP